MEHFTKKTRLPAPAREVYEWHLRPDALELLTPPWEKVRVMDRGRGVAEGSRVRLALAVGPFRLPWIAEHGRVEAGRRFEDVQVRGPFAHWHHRHLFEPDGEQASWMIDEVDYRLPGGFLGRWLGAGHARRKIQRMFDYRHQVLQEHFPSRPRNAAA